MKLTPGPRQISAAAALCGLAICMVNNLSALAADEPAKEKKAPGKEENLRDPFWPVGFIPQSADEQLRKQIQKTNPVNWPKLNPIGFSKTPKGNMVLLKGIGPVEEGRVIKLKKGRRVYVYKIGSITDKQFKAIRVDTYPIGN